MKTIGLLTSGGDSPGMNAAVRSVVRSASYAGLQVKAVSRGYQGLIDREIVEVNTHSVSDIIQRGGTVLKSARSEMFYTPEGRARAAATLRDEHVEALIVIGGDGSFRGANLLADEHHIPVIGIPATIDNDLAGTDETIGYDTALNTAMEAIDKIRDTADAHERLFLVEVMGRDAGFIALETGISVGAEMILLPESLTDMDEVRSSLKDILKEQKRSTLVMVAEGNGSGGAQKLEAELKGEFSKYDMRVCILGHIQRGGSPTARDRVLASRLGHAAVKAAMDGHTKVMVGVVNSSIKLSPLKMASTKKKDIDYETLELSKILR